MPKFSTLPIATSSKSNDIICIVDTDAGVSKQIPLSVLNSELKNGGILFGAAIQNISISASPVDITGYAGAGSSGSENQATGEITISEDGLYRVSSSLVLSTVSNTNNANMMIVASVATVASTIIFVLGTESLGSFNHTIVVPSGSRVMNLLAGDIVKIQVSQENATDTYSVDDSEFYIERVQ